MSVIHRTTMSPTKHELIEAWLPGRPWYIGRGEPLLAKAGGFRLDDPQGEVGIEFMVVTDSGAGASGADSAADGPVAYLVPVTYRGAPLDGAGHGLIGTAEHGVLGRRWVYDGVHDPVLVGRLVALVLGEAIPQRQSESNASDPTVASAFTGDGLAATTPPTAITEGPRSTDLVVPTAAAPGAVTLRLHRVLPAAVGAPAVGHVTAPLLHPDGTTTRTPFVTVHATAPQGG
ncbi:1,4-alpha-glucan branching protein [Streptomyces sp. NPDC060194]|uniref:maltokinase N-terminal cap-like domain-containing protein n=1 Tax=Streptomyces sp. NPDC060194 TaxID=3347069 RepID=UPI00364D931C